MSASRIEGIRDRLLSVGQEKLALHLDSLESQKAEMLAKSVESIDFDSLQKAWLRSETKMSSNIKTSDKIEPSVHVTKERLKSNKNSSTHYDTYYRIGEKIIQNAEAALLIMSGGMGSRLGFDGPKGAFMLNDKVSVFQTHIDEVKCLLKSCAVFDETFFPNIIIMCSNLNYKAIKTFFEEKDYFGYPKDKLIFFTQSNLPALDTNGEILLKDEISIMSAPDGNGGIYKALLKSGVAAALLKKGIKWLHVAGVDNVLHKPLDPIFLGYTEHSGFKIASKSVARLDVDEKVGILLNKNGEPAVLEYSEISQELLHAKSQDGGFLFDDANIASHLFDLASLVNRISSDLPCHRAHKRIDYFDIDPNSPNYLKYVKPIEENAYKLEYFLFDIFSSYDKMAVMRVDRETEFAPLKNKTGRDSVESARQAYETYWR